jgi:hypothetical protein
MSDLGGNEKRRAPILLLKIHVTASFNQLLHNSSMPNLCRNGERCDPILFLKINVTASCNQ